MFKQMPIRLRLTAMMVILLTLCCVGLTVILNLSAVNMATKIDAVATFSTPAQQVDEESNEMGHFQTSSSEMSLTPSINAQEARTDFQFESIMYMLVVIVVGGALTYYVSGKVLKPLTTLNRQIQNRTVHNLSESMDIPPTHDEIAELTQSFNDMTDKLNAAFMMQRRFSADAAHELRTPLAVLTTKIDVFKKKNTHSIEQYDELITIFEKQTQRLSELVVTLLEMTNMNDEFEKETIHLKVILQEVVEELSPIADEKEIQLYLDGEDGAVLGNIDLLYRAFYNIVENGIKYNHAGGAVNIQIQSNNHQIMVAIKDTGIGISDEEKKNIFEPFYRVDQSRSRAMGGSGLGLAIVEGIINKHNGKITVTSNEADGTCFQICLEEA